MRLSAWWKPKVSELQRSGGATLDPPLGTPDADVSDNGDDLGNDSLDGERTDVVPDVWWRDPISVAGLIALVLMVFAVGEWYMRNVEMTQVTEAVEHSEEAMDRYNEELQALAETHQRSEYYQQGRATEDFLESVSEAAETAEGALIVSDDELRSVRVVPWHRSIMEARSKYLRHSAAWRRRYKAISADPRAAADRDGEISGSFIVAGRAMKTAVPPWPMKDLDERVADVFKS